MNMYVDMNSVDRSCHINTPDGQVILVSEKGVVEFGWKYILVLLHEIGHAIYDAEDPESAERYQDVCKEYHQNKTKETLLNKLQVISQHERKAWAITIREFRKLLRKFNIPQAEVFSDKDEFMSYIREISANYGMDAGLESLDNLKEDIPKEEKEELAEEIYNLYLGRR